MASAQDGMPGSKVPVRTCVGCRSEAERGAMVRLAHDGERFVPDLRGTLGGRGIHVHARKSCVMGACRGGFSRALRREVKVDARALLALLVTTFEARATALVGAARRARAVTLGTDATVEAVRDGKVELLVVASDARAAADVATELAKHVPLGSVRFADKATLGKLLGKDEEGLVGVVDAGLARTISEAAIAIARLTEGE